MSSAAGAARRRGVVHAALAMAAVVALFLAAACGGSSQSTATPTPTSSAGGATPTPTEAPAFDAEAYFRGKTITIIDGFSPGGSSDTLARMFARVAPKHFPGSPQFVVQNVPGSGGLRGLQETLRSRPDAMTLGMVHNRFVKQTIAGDPIEGFDLATVKWIGVPDVSRTYRAIYVRRSVATSWADVMALGRPITLGGTAPGDTQGAGGAFISAIGGPINLVYGYGGTSEIMAAFDRGELDAVGSGEEPTVMRLYPAWIENKYMVPVFWWSEPVPQEYLDKLDADEPIHIYDTMPMTDEQKAVFDLIENLNLLSSRTFFLPAETPDEVYQAVLEAWERTVQDPEFIQAKVAGGFEEGYVSAEQIREVIGSSQGLAPEGIELFRVLAGVTE